LYYAQRTISRERENELKDAYFLSKELFESVTSFAAQYSIYAFARNMSSTFSPKKKQTNNRSHFM
jgi:hypothetical protein